MGTDEHPGEKERRPGTKKGGADEFDAVAAAAELDESLGKPSGEPGGADRYVRLLESEVESLGALVETKEAEVKRAHERAEKARDEVAGARERLERDAGREAEARVRKVLASFLSVADDLDRAIEAAAAGGAGLAEGVGLVRKKLLSVLGEHAVRHIPALGERFDPAVHEAISTAAAASPDEDGRITAVVREGYAIGDEVLRAAQVVVAKS
jgi:molecular chaperone GrpE